MDTVVYQIDTQRIHLLLDGYEDKDVIISNVNKNNLPLGHHHHLRQRSLPLLQESREDQILWLGKQGEKPYLILVSILIHKKQSGKTSLINLLSINESMVIVSRHHAMTIQLNYGNLLIG